MSRKFKIFLALWVVLCCAAAWVAYDYIWLKGEPTYTVSSRAAMERALSRGGATVLLPPDEALPAGEVTRSLTAYGQTRLDDIWAYYITVGENFSLGCEIPRPDQREVPGMPGYVTHGSGTVFWKQDDPIQPTDTIAGTPVQLQQRPTRWRVKFDAHGCRYTLEWEREGVSREDVAAFCEALLTS